MEESLEKSHIHVEIPICGRMVNMPIEGDNN